MSSFINVSGENQTITGIQGSVRHLDNRTFFSSDKPTFDPNKFIKTHCDSEYGADTYGPLLLDIIYGENPLPEGLSMDDYLRLSLSDKQNYLVNALIVSVNGTSYEKMVKFRTINRKFTKARKLLDRDIKGNDKIKVHKRNDNYRYEENHRRGSRNRSRSRSRSRSNIRDRNGIKQPSKLMKQKGHRSRSGRMTGIVKRWNSTKGFGFIACSDGDNIFVHQTAIHKNGFRSLRIGESVEFNIVVQGDGRRKAVDVTGPHGAFVKGDGSRPNDNRLHKYRSSGDTDDNRYKNIKRRTDNNNYNQTERMRAPAVLSQKRINYKYNKNRRENKLNDNINADNPIISPNTDPITISNILTKSTADQSNRQHHVPLMDLTRINANRQQKEVIQNNRYRIGDNNQNKNKVPMKLPYIRQMDTIAPKDYNSYRVTVNSKRNHNNSYSNNISYGRTANIQPLNKNRQFNAPLMDLSDMDGIYHTNDNDMMNLLYNNLEIIRNVKPTIHDKTINDDEHDDEKDDDDDVTTSHPNKRGVDAFRDHWFGYTGGC
eukprot:459343_1